MTTPPDFVHLHVHSQYSILDGQASIQKLVDKAMRDGQPGIALTDHGNMFGIKEFYNYFKQWQNRFILHVGDLVAVQKIGENKIIVLSKISMVVKTEGEGTNGNE